MDKVRDLEVSYKKNKLIKALPSQCGFHGCLISSTNLCYYRSTHRSACETMFTKGCSHKHQCDSMKKLKSYLFMKIQERLQKSTFWSHPCSTLRKSSLSKYEEGVNCDRLSIRIFISLCAAPWNWWSYHLNGQTSRSSFFSKLIPSQIVKPLKKKL